MGWQIPEYGESHDGWAGAVLDDGSEPDAVYLDAGSGSDMLRTREWWAYSGSLGRPKAAAFRGLLVRMARTVPPDRLGPGKPAGRG